MNDDSEKPDRDFLIEEAKYGRLNPEEAEALAKQHGLDPLQAAPNPNDYEVLLEPWWTLPMAMAWILWKDDASVIEFFDPYRTECFDWHHRKWRLGFTGPIHEGHFLESRSPATLTTVQMTRWFNQSGTDAELPTTSTAEEEFIRALKNGTLVATGIPTDGEKRQAIDAHDWNDLKLFEEDGRDVAKRGAFGHGYRDIMLSSQVVMARWPKRQTVVKAEYALPETIKPEGPGYFSLYSAAQWIATAGGRISFHPEDAAVWENAFRQLLDAIASNLIEVTGVRGGVREKIDGHIFASLNVDFPYGQTSLSLLLGEELYLSSCPYTDEEHWRRGFNDSLQNRQGAQWLQLMTRKSDVATVWPFDAMSGRTGSPGRPTSAHLVVDEHKRRLTNGAAEGAVAQEAKHLAQWLSITHPTAPRLTVKTIENNIRAAHRAAKAPKT